MTKDDCKFNFEWDYSQFGNTELGSALYHQIDWNQTLMTKINQTSAHIHKASLVGGGSHIITSTKLQPLFETLEYYYGNSLSGRYTVLFNDNFTFKFGTKYKFPENVIYVFNNKIYDTILLLPKVTPETDDKMGEVSLSLNYTHEELIEYKKGLCGSITVLNYE